MEVPYHVLSIIIGTQNSLWQAFVFLLSFSYKFQSTEMEVIQLVSFIVAAITKYC